MKFRNRFAVLSALSVLTAAASAGEVKVSLKGEHEVPAVETAATGTATLHVNDDKTVKGSVKTSGIEGVAAHIHLAAPGKNGPPVITLTKSENGEWTVPAAATLTDEQYASYQAGDLYINVHSAAHKSGEIRGQIKP